MGKGLTYSGKGSCFPPQPRVSGGHKKSRQLPRECGMVVVANGFRICTSVSGVPLVSSGACIFPVLRRKLAGKTHPVVKLASSLDPGVCGGPAVPFPALYVTYSTLSAMTKWVAVIGFTAYAFIGIISGRHQFVTLMSEFSAHPAPHDWNDMLSGKTGGLGCLQTERDVYDLTVRSL